MESTHFKEVFYIMRTGFRTLKILLAILAVGTLISISSASTDPSSSKPDGKVVTSTPDKIVKSAASAPAPSDKKAMNEAVARQARFSAKTIMEAASATGASLEAPTACGTPALGQTASGKMLCTFNMTIPADRKGQELVLLLWLSTPVEDQIKSYLLTGAVKLAPEYVQQTAGTMRHVTFQAIPTAEKIADNMPPETTLHVVLCADTGKDAPVILAHTTSTFTQPTTSAAGKPTEKPSVPIALASAETK